MALEYSCECGTEWEYSGNTATTFRDGGIQTWANSKDTERVDLCPSCGKQGTTKPVNYKEKNVGMKIPDQGANKTYIR